MNKKSAQKQKQTCNNGFSQAVVPQKSQKPIRYKQKQTTKQTRQTAVRVFTFRPTKTITSAMPIVQSILTSGSEGVIVHVESHLSNGLPSIIIVGLGGKAVDEAKDRVRSAFASNRLPMPRKRVTINLAPADIPKESTSLDLAIALSILQAGGQIKDSLNSHSVVIGELGLAGDVRAVRGIIGKILAAKSKGINEFYLPAENLEQALLVPNILITPLKNISELYRLLNGEIVLTKQRGGVEIKDGRYEIGSGVQLEDIVGQRQAKRALQIAAAGNHNILLNGAPGTGKTMLARALPSIMPQPSRQEILEITNLHSMVSGNYEQLIYDRPFRAPHHTASHVAITGGGLRLRPGEVTLAHRGVLFLDEFPEFNRATLEALRQPLEDRTVVVSRAKDTITYPANFILIAAANPCPCGYYGSKRGCICSANDILRYRQKISGPILDRIDLHVTMEDVNHEELLQTSKDKSNASAKQAIRTARKLQLERFNSRVKSNVDMTNRDIRKHALLEPEAELLLNQAAQKLGISARTYMRVIKVARTIADMAESPHIRPEDMLEALQYRTQPTVDLA